jgi:hypothetical protein
MVADRAPQREVRHHVTSAESDQTRPPMFATTAVQTQARDELMKIVDLHQKVAHQEITQSQETWAFVKTLVREVAPPGPKAEV